MDDVSESQVPMESAGEADAVGDIEKMTISSTSGHNAAGGADGKANSHDGQPEDEQKSALADNIARKGSNAYYFAHAHKANGPKWDGKAEPKLLHRLSSADGSTSIMIKAPSFLYHKSNITSYAFLNEDKVVKLYVNMEDVGEKCNDQDITLDWDESSFSLVVRNLKETDQCLSFGKLTGKITDAKYKIKKDKIILTLTKEKEGVDWHTVNDKGTPDHELV
jgi:hypothetical protein